MRVDTLLIEIGTEELPSSYMPYLEKDLQVRFQEWLQAECWVFAHCGVSITPRRLVFRVGSLSENQQKQPEWIKGPPLRAALTADNHQTPALKGFLNRCRSEQYEIRNLDNGQYVFGLSQPENQTAQLFFSQNFPKFILKYPFEKQMRWEKYQFIRPIKWVLSLYGSESIPMILLDTESRSVSRLLQGQAEIPVQSVEAYDDMIQQNGILLSGQSRESAIRSHFTSESCPPRSSVVTENASRTEVPVVVEAIFPEKFIQLPGEVIETVLSSQMKCFPMYKDSGNQLTNHFRFVMNGYRDRETVKKGFEKVMTARLSDAAYFYEQDHKIPFSSRNGKLSTVLFMEKLGTMDQKVQRISLIAEKLASFPEIQRLPELLTVISLYKVDLTTLLVQELTELQGAVGRIYSKEAGIDQSIALAIEESYQPKSEEDALPHSDLGRMISLLDRWDTWIGVHCIGLSLSSSGDPLGIRRTVNGLLRILMEKPGNIPLETYVDSAITAYQQINGMKVNPDKVTQEWKAYYCQRMRSLLSDQYRYDIIQSVLSENNPPNRMIEKIQLIEKELGNNELKNLYQAFVRMQKITQTPYMTGSPSRNLLEANAEKNLWDIAIEVESVIDQNKGSIQYELQQLYRLNRPIEQFFIDVMVMADDQEIRENRLRMLSWILSLISRFADFSKLVFEGGNEQ